MLSNNMKKLLPTIGFILVAVVVSIMLLNYFNINVSDNSGLRVLNRTAVFEGLCGGKQHKEGLNNKKEGASNLMEES